MTECIDVAQKTSLGSIGFIASKMLENVNGVLSAIVAIMTIIYLFVSIRKKMIDTKKDS
jgi:hypothetical protein